MRIRWIKPPLIALGLVVVVSLAQADNAVERQQAEQQLENLQQEIQALGEQLRQSRADLGDVQTQLREIDLSIQQASLESRRLLGLIADQELALTDLEEQREEQLDRLDSRMGQLAEQVRSSYRAGKQSRLQLLLNQDDPAGVSRMLAYYEYLNRAQLGHISRLRSALEALEAVQAAIRAELQQLARLQEEQQSVLRRLETQRGEREQLLARLAAQVGSEESRLAELQRDREDLQALVDRLADVLADIPADLDQQQRISQRKGRLGMPLKGPVRHAYGEHRAGGMRWQGWLIGAEPGSEVHAVANGRVAFADWLRGYGLLLIIDHGDGFMSLYGNNESLLQEVGAWVASGDAIGIVGTHPAGDQGLFFELRKDGRAIDPAGWINRRD